MEVVGQVEGFGGGLVGCKGSGQQGVDLAAELVGRPPRAAPGPLARPSPSLRPQLDVTELDPIVFLTLKTNHPRGVL